MNRFLMLVQFFFPGFAYGVIDFERDVWPILEERCVECHKAPYELNGILKEPKAGLRMDGAAYLMHGGDDGPVVVASHPSRSSLYQRVVLAADDDDVMPPKGDPLTKRQKEILRKWIAQGLDFGKWVGETDGVEELLQKKKSERLIYVPEHIKFYEGLGRGLKPIPKEELLRISREANLMIRPIGVGSPLLEVRVVTDPFEVGNGEVEKLRPLANHIAKLDLRNTSIDEASCLEIARFVKLAELNLRGNKIGDSALLAISSLSSLQVLNLCETDVSDRALIGLRKFKSLRKVYLWGSRVSQEGAGKLRHAMKSLDVSL